MIAPSARVLAVNVGSGTLKWTLFGVPGRRELDAGSEPWSADPAQQLEATLQALPPFDAVGHRLVHGGTRFVEPTLIDGAVRAQLGELAALDPLHMTPALHAIDLLARLHPGRPQVGAFDTAFHSTLSPAAACYALPYEWTERWGLRRFGFHGLSVQHAVHAVTAAAGVVPETMIVCHLGSGCSVTAVRQGHSVDTTMGFTPLEGLMMGTRSGTVDPGLLLHLQGAHRLTAAELHEALSRRSGLLGMSGVSADLRAVLAAAAAGSPRATLAYERFVLDVRRAIGAMAGVLGGAQVLVYTGGIGENSARLRAETAEALAGHGLRLDADANRAAREGADLAAAASAVRVYIVASREDRIILEQVLRRLPQLGAADTKAAA